MMDLQAMLLNTSYNFMYGIFFTSVIKIISHIMATYLHLWKKWGEISRREQLWSHPAHSFPVPFCTHWSLDSNHPKKWFINWWNRVHFPWYLNVIFDACQMRRLKLYSPQQNKTQESCSKKEMFQKPIDLWNGKRRIPAFIIIRHWMAKPKTMIRMRLLSWHLVEWQWNAFNLVISR